MHGRPTQSPDPARKMRHLPSGTVMGKIFSAQNNPVRPAKCSDINKSIPTVLRISFGKSWNLPTPTLNGKGGIEANPKSFYFRVFNTKPVTTRVFGEENPTPCTLVIVPGSVAITYRTHYRIISFPYNEIRVQNIIFTSETSRYTNLVQTPWAKRQVEILRSGS
jgi:hypothetical protein